MTQTFKTKGVPRRLGWLAVIGFLLPSLPARAAPGVMAARALTITTRLEAYARVEPISIFRLNAVRGGVVTGLKVLPGEIVKSGSVLGYLKGPSVEGLLARRQAAVAGARSARSAARKALAVARQKRAERLGTLEAVFEAEAAMAESQARLDTARSRLRAVQAEVVLDMPVSGTVLTVNASEGERVQPGQTILTVVPADAFWLKADYYGSNAAVIHAGMKGRFLPAGGYPAIPVKVRAIIGPVQSDGGQEIGLIATVPAPDWRNGEAGTVILQGPVRTLPAVPTRALIIYQGRWWVLVHTNRGDRRQAVVPGPSRGDSTLIERGLKPGTEVVVENAYLEFHRAFSRHYEPPD